MKTLKVSIHDEHTLILQEDGHKGDVIDLQTLHDINLDQSSLRDLTAKLKKEVLEQEIKQATTLIEKQKTLEYELKEQAWQQKINLLEQEKKSAVQLVVQEAQNKNQTLLTQKQGEIQQLQANLQAQETAKKLAITQAIQQLEKDNDRLKQQLEYKEQEKKLATTSLKEKYEQELKSKDDLIAYHKDLKQRLSTKMLGETLEQHCEIEFNKIRATAFPQAYFEKDNNASGGSKGDYIFRETNSEGVEIISIMFEMKNEADESIHKKKNEDFLAKLDKDRREKNCEYAVLVSLLEKDNELYNNGIVDVAHKYHKMYVVRPQFFIPIITLLRNASLQALQYKTELAVIRSQNLDISKFEDEVNHWKESWLKTIHLAGQRHSDAIAQIDNAIKNLEKVREALILSDKHLLTAENKMDDLTIKRLTRGNPTMQEKFVQVQKKNKPI